MATSQSQGLNTGGLMNFLIASDLAAGQAKVARAKKAAQRAENKARQSEATLLRWNQSLSNQRIMENAGENYNTLTENLGRTMDAHVASNVQARLAASEELGAATAAFAFAGVGGSSVDNYNQTMKTSFALSKEQSDRSYNSQTYLLNKDRGSQISDAVASMDRSVIVADQDFSYVGSTSGGSFLGNLATLAVAAGASAAGAPDVGNAILSARTSSLQAGYGDTAGANKSFSNTLSSIQGAVNTARDQFRFRNQSSTSSSVGIGSPLTVGRSNVGSYFSTTLR